MDLLKTIFRMIFIFLFCAQAMGETKSIFKIAPYISVADKGQLTLNFQTNETTELQIKLMNEDTEISSFKGNYANTSFTQIEIGSLQCGKRLHTIISSKVKTETESTYFSLPCADENKPLVFGFMSDTQIKSLNGQERANILSNTIEELRSDYPFSLIINGGDIVQHGGLEDQWYNFFNTANVYLGKTFLFAASGNHEYYESQVLDKAPPLYLKYMRNNALNSPALGYAALDLGRINIFMINSNFDFMSEQKIREQWDWLENHLKNAEKIHKPSLIVMHHAAYSSSVDSFHDNSVRLRKDFVPMIEKYKSVKMVLNGHLHMLERSFKNGIYYFTAGPSGGINNVVTHNNPFSKFILSFTTSFSIFSVTKERIDITTYSGKKEVIDQVSIPLR